MKKKAVSVICAIVTGACCFLLNAQAKVIEPEVVKTEKWTTSYYIDDVVDTLYPYIQCEADIYNDGTIKLYMWNTHKWESWITGEHKITLQQTSPFTTVSKAYYLIYNGSFCNQKYIYPNPDPVIDEEIDQGLKSRFESQPVSSFEESKSICLNTLKKYDLSYYPAEYEEFSIAGTAMMYLGVQDAPVVAYVQDGKWVLDPSELTGNTELKVELNSIASGTERPESPLLIREYRPKSIVDKAYKFRLYGHDITITPELLSGNVVATPQLTEQEAYIQKLEAENAALKAENEKLKKQLSSLSGSLFCDVNQDGIVGVEDAQLVLMYYTETVAGKTNGDPIEIWYTKRNTISG